MNQTSNYQLNQWEKTDRVQMEDFNNDNAKIDAALKAANEAAAAAAANGAKIVTGAYTGNGAATRTISLGFTPKAVLVMTNQGEMRDLEVSYGGLAVTGYPAVNRGVAVVTIVSNGFQVVYNDASTSTYKHYSNRASTTYHYVAVG